MSEFLTVQVRIPEIRARPLKKEVKDGWREVCLQVRPGKRVFWESPSQLSPQTGFFVCLGAGQVLALPAHLPVASLMPRPGKWGQKQQTGVPEGGPSAPVCLHWPFQ